MQALLGRWIAADVKLVHVENTTEGFNGLPGNRYAGTAELSQDGGGNQADEQPKDGDDDKHFEQREAALPRSRAPGSGVMAVPYLACMALVALIYQLPPRVLPAIQRVEGGTAGMINRNTDGTEDYGVMQVNSRWLPALSAYTGLSREAVRAQLIGRPCFNIAAGGAVLRTYLNETRGDLMLAIGDYHSHTAERNHAYQLKVMRSAGALFGTAGR